MHTEEKPKYQCEQCPKYFSRNERLVSHVKKEHTPNLPSEEFETDME